MHRIAWLQQGLPSLLKAADLTIRLVSGPSFRPSIHPSQIKVMKEYNAEGLSASEQTAEGKLAAGIVWQERLQGVLADHSSMAPSGRALVARQADKLRSSAYDHARALDHTLMLVGSGLKHFLPVGEDAWVTECCKPLKAGEARIYIKSDGTWPFEVPATVANLGKKAVLLHSDGEQRKYEVPEFFAERPVLSLYCDQGSKFWSCCWFLQARLFARIVVVPDPAHRAWNDYRLAVDTMGWRPQLLEGCLLLNFRHGPWLSCSWWAQLQAGLEEFIRIWAPSDELWAMLYPMVAREYNMHADLDFGSEEHLAKVQEMVIQCRAFAVKGEKVALRSFFKWIRAMKEFASQWHSVLVVPIVMGIRKGWFQRGLVPGIGSTTAGNLVEPPASADDEQDRVTGCMDDRTLQQLRNQCHNSMHVVAEILGNSKKEFIMKCMALFGEPFQIEHDLTIALCKDSQSVVRYYTSSAKGKFCFTSVRLLRLWALPETLSALGVCTEPASFGWSRQAVNDNIALKMELQGEDEKYRLMWQFRLAPHAAALGQHVPLAGWVAGPLRSAPFRRREPRSARAQAVRASLERDRRGRAYCS